MSTRLLVVTQVIDTNDPVLGFFHSWLNSFAGSFSHIHVLCLKKGAHSLPRNVQVHSLGKERGGGRVVFTIRFFKHIWRLRAEYDAVLVHMNPEYVVLAGILWRLLGKRVYLWRNHWAKGLLTDIAVALSHKTFCTSKSSYITKYKKNVLMPVGIDTDQFKPSGVGQKGSILSLGRIAPSKNIHLILAALKLLKERGIAFTASIYGDALPKDAAYLAEQKRYVVDNNLTGHVTFHPGVANTQTPAIYSAHQIFVNASVSGMFDKTMFEALACGAITIASSPDYKDFAGEAYSFAPNDIEGLAAKIERFLDSSQIVSSDLRQKLEREHSLRVLTSRLAHECTV